MIYLIIVLFIFINFYIFYNYPDILLITFNNNIIFYNKRTKKYFRYNLFLYNFNDLIVSKTISEYEIKTSQDRSSYVKYYYYNILKFFKIIRLIDITIHKRRHKQLVERNNQLDYFIYKCSHDLKSPVTSMKGLLSLIILDEKNKEKYIDLMKECIEYMENNVNSIANFQKTQEFELKYEEFNLYELVEYIIRQIRYSRKSIKLINDIDKKLKIKSDKLILTSIIQNILSNSFKYSDKNKDENIIKISYENNDNHTIKIWDNGIGISKEHLPKIGEIFFKVNDISNSTGLGMFIIKKSLEKMDGTIEIDSIEHEYTCFKFTLPLNVK